MYKSCLSVLQLVNCQEFSWCCPQTYIWPFSFNKCFSLDLKYLNRRIMPRIFYNLKIILHCTHLSTYNTWEIIRILVMSNCNHISCSSDSWVIIYDNHPMDMKTCCNSRCHKFIQAMFGSYWWVSKLLPILFIANIHICRIDGLWGHI